MHKKEKMLFAVFAAALILGASCIIDQEAEETDAVDPVILTVVVLSLMTASFVGGYVIASMNTPEGNDDRDRSLEASSVMQSVTAGLAYYDNALANYDQIWRLTNEHWIRQSELSAAAVWQPGSDYSPTEILDHAGVYVNSAHMMTNAAAQINAHYDSMSERLALWQEHPVYANGNLALRLILGNDALIMSSGSSGTWSLMMGTSPVSAGYVYLTEGTYKVSEQVTITPLSGAPMVIGPGTAVLNSSSGFQEGIYHISGTGICGNILPILGPGAANIHASMAADVGNGIRLITHNGTQLLSGGTVYNTMKVQVVPSSGTVPPAVDITDTLSDYNALLATVKDSMRRASSSAATVWDIYDRAGASSEYLTTLMVPDFYQNVELTQGQKSLITTLALQQLSDYYQEHSGQIKTGNYLLTGGSMQLFCRGDVTTAAGKLYEDVIFSPIFYRDTTLNTGSNHFTGTGFVCIWGKAPTLSSWEGTSSPDDGALIYLASGADLDIFEMKYGGEYVSTVALEVSEIDIIDPNEIDPDPLPPSEGSGLTDIVTAVLVIFGIVALLGGAVTRSPMLIVIGAALVLLGLFAAGPIASFLGTFGVKA